MLTSDSAIISPHLAKPFQVLRYSSENIALVTVLCGMVKWWHMRTSSPSKNSFHVYEKELMAAIIFYILDCCREVLKSGKITLHGHCQTVVANSLVWRSQDWQAQGLACAQS